MGFTIGALLGGTNPMQGPMCADDTTFSTQDNNALCAAQGKRNSRYWYLISISVLVGILCLCLCLMDIDDCSGDLRECDP